MTMRQPEVKPRACASRISPSASLPLHRGEQLLTKLPDHPASQRQ